MQDLYVNKLIFQLFKLISFSRCFFKRKIVSFFLGLPHEEELHRIFPCWIAWNRKIITIDLDVFFHLYKTTQRDSFGTYTYRIPNITNKQKKVDMLSDFVCVCVEKGVRRCERYLFVGALAFEIQIGGFGVNFGVKCNQLDCILSFGDCGQWRTDVIFTFGWCK